MQSQQSIKMQSEQGKTKKAMFNFQVGGVALVPIEFVRLTGLNSICPSLGKLAAALNISD